MIKEHCTKRSVWNVVEYQFVHSFFIIQNHPDHELNSLIGNYLHFEGNVKNFNKCLLAEFYSMKPINQMAKMREIAKEIGIPVDFVAAYLLLHHEEEVNTWR